MSINLFKKAFFFIGIHIWGSCSATRAIPQAIYFSNQYASAVYAIIDINPLFYIINLLICVFNSSNAGDGRCPSSKNVISPPSITTFTGSLA